MGDVWVTSRQAAVARATSPAVSQQLCHVAALASHPVWIESVRRWVLRTSHLFVLVVVLAATCTANVSASHGLLAFGFGAFSLYFLLSGRRLVEMRNHHWRWLHAYAWLVLLLILLTQAPLLPEKCVAVLGSNESEGTTWCAARHFGRGCKVGCFPWSGHAGGWLCHAHLT